MESTFGGALAPIAEGAAWAPLTDIEETDDAFLIEIDVPGVKRDDINIELNDRELSISGEYKERERTGVLRRGTRRTGRPAGSSTALCFPARSTRRMWTRPSARGC
ncbi:Hsp20/alpha crystallin family protein [Streptomyces sp. ALI-76-A]|uniref:Hsp20/alpha crystallin family protein n=1 Tax=Streptomyces sp. ALI-76-A TaxID=3025736 RepID=UPI00256EF4EF|nr:Hsp20/alpha crystallin family protein [Streptomyces sp. ALI-76-A]MDL5199699.1 Hsp20/alpha crystallin family protein [Streptomyces sp. ALI-76-A]